MDLKTPMFNRDLPFIICVSTKCCG